MGLSGRKLGNWGHALEGDTGTPPLLSVWFSTNMRWASSSAVCFHYNVLPHYRPKGNKAKQRRTETWNQNESSLLLICFFLMLQRQKLHACTCTCTHTHMYISIFLYFIFLLKSTLNVSLIPLIHKKCIPFYSLSAWINLSSLFSKPFMKLFLVIGHLLTREMITFCSGCIFVFHWIFLFYWNILLRNFR